MRIRRRVDQKVLLDKWPSLADRGQRLGDVKWEIDAIPLPRFLRCSPLPQAKETKTERIQTGSPRNEGGAGRGWRGTIHLIC